MPAPPGSCQCALTSDDAVASSTASAAAPPPTRSTSRGTRSMASVGDDIKHCQSKSVLVPSWSWSSPLAGQPAAWAMPTTPSLLRSPPRTSPTNYLWPVGRLPRRLPRRRLLRRPRRHRRPLRARQAALRPEHDLPRQDRRDTDGDGACRRGRGGYTSGCSAATCGASGASSTKWAAACPYLGTPVAVMLRS